MNCYQYLYTFYIDNIKKFLCFKKYKCYYDSDIKEPDEIECLIIDNINHPFDNESQVLFY